MASDLVLKELDKREKLVAQILELVYQICDDGYGHVRRGIVQNHVYHSLGFKGRPGNRFSTFINQVLEENGYRCSWYEGIKIYCGLQIKNAPSKPAS